ncbi:uncharacterized protein YpmS [Melghiribacillus thermohalophilus]|uniref:Uncharacterized protein YpmS n=1 Tax=Melghiribacillus thermohalophilus TaxID=1324956 RepID=A0A4R3N7D3_9BACI|nr:YpmS family protein [Melghiribacillus thermohalophilus]TCT25045.1 uncharacterized protein YpmS [Melghiribacillus thermohalophilus]
MFSRFTSENKWKTLFFVLAGINVAFLCWLFSYLFALPVNIQQDQQPIYDEQTAIFTVNSTRENLNILINSYLDQLPKSDIYNYSVNLNQNVQLSGSIMAFGRKVPIEMTMEPYVLKNGDLVLNVISVTLGRLPLPNKKVLDYIRDHYHLPEWVIIDPARHRIYAAVTQMKTKSHFHVRVKEFNLEHNEFSFQITVPSHSFDLDHLEKVF